MLAAGSGCATKSDLNSEAEQVLNELEQMHADLTISLKEPAISQIQYKVLTDLQFERGCRQQGIVVEECDFQNTLSVDFDEFDCFSYKEPENQFSSLKSIKDGGASCDYKGTIMFADGRTETIERKSERYKLEYYSDGLSHEYVWRKQ